MDPYWSDDLVTLWHGDCRELIPSLGIRADSCVTDPPYEEIGAKWDVWPSGWLEAVGQALPESASLWCFGSARMFLERAPEFFAGWKFAQDTHFLWEKHNGSGPGSADRLFKVHELAYHWYRGRWSDLHHSWERQAAEHGDKGHVRRLARAAEHQRPGRQNAWTDNGTRQRRSVAHVKAQSVRFKGRHWTEKPSAVVSPLVAECTPPGATVLDPMAGSGVVGDAAQTFGMKAVLIEADEASCEEIAKRLEIPRIPMPELAL